MENVHEISDAERKDDVHPSIRAAMDANSKQRRDREQKRLDRNQQIADKARREQGGGDHRRGA